MPKKDLTAKGPASDRGKINAQPRLHQRAGEIQKYGTVSHMLPLDLEEPVRLEMTEQLNLMLADTMTLRDLYKKSHWQVAGPTFYQLHLLFDKHFGEQSDWSIRSRSAFNCWVASPSPWRPMLRRPRASNVLRRAGKRFQCKFRGCWMPTRSSSAIAANWRNAPIS